MIGTVIVSPWYIEPTSASWPRYEPAAWVLLTVPVAEDRDALSRLRSLLVLSQLMMESASERQIEDEGLLEAPILIAPRPHASWLNGAVRTDIGGWPQWIRNVTTPPASCCGW